MGPRESRVQREWPFLHPSCEFRPFQLCAPNSANWSCASGSAIFHGMSGSLKQLSNENGPVQGASKVTDTQDFRVRQ